MPYIKENEDNASDSSDTLKEGGSSKGPKSDISGRSRGGASAMSRKSRADSYAPSQAASQAGSNASALIKGGGRGGTRRKATDYMKMDISTARIICLGCTPRCCRTKGQSALNRLLEKGYNKL